jgi:RNA polymerase sigma-70 factor (ECF subfamily)
LHHLCANLLYRSYRRLTLPPLNLQPDELLSAVVERLLKAMRSFRPQRVRQFVEAAEVLSVSTKTVQRRLNRALVLLAAELKDLHPKLEEG